MMLSRTRALLYIVLSISIQHLPLRCFSFLQSNQRICEKVSFHSYSRFATKAVDTQNDIHPRGKQPSEGKSPSNLRKHSLLGKISSKKRNDTTRQRPTELNTEIESSQREKKTSTFPRESKTTTKATSMVKDKNITPELVINQVIAPMVESSIYIHDDSFRNSINSFRKSESPKKLFNYVMEYAGRQELTQNMTAYAFRTLLRMNRHDLCSQLFPVWEECVKASGNAAGNAAGKSDVVVVSTTPSSNTALAGFEVEAAQILLKGFLRMKDIELAERVATLAGFRLSFDNDNDNYNDNYNDNDNGKEEKYVNHHINQAVGTSDAFKIMLPELAVAYISRGQIKKTIFVLQEMIRLSEPIDLETSKTILKIGLKYCSLPQIVKIISLLLPIGGLRDNDSIQLLTSAFLRSIDFVKGAVSVETLPSISDNVVQSLLMKQANTNTKSNTKSNSDKKRESVSKGSKGSSSSMNVGGGDIPEVAFIGRSNVGKSSLINMLCNRKGLAFTSKTPGKTSEFNYFLAQGLVGGGNVEISGGKSLSSDGTKAMDMNAVGGEGMRQSGSIPFSSGNGTRLRRVPTQTSRFYLVDLPGVGYAEASRSKRDSWLSLLQSYANTRSSLRVIFHLIDSRHGLLEADEGCLSLLPSLPASVQYCIVLTKADKSKCLTGGVAGGGNVISNDVGGRQELRSRVRQDIMERVRNEVAKRTERNVPILITSSETREGGVDVWHEMLSGILREP